MSPSDVERIREALENARRSLMAVKHLDRPTLRRVQVLATDGIRWAEGGIAALDGVTGLAREGDVVLSGEQAAFVANTLYRLRGDDFRTDYRNARILLASGRPDTEQA